jgi:hypothetical protein
MTAADADDDDDDAASDMGISNESKSESESELILSPVLATFNSHVSMSGEPSSMLSLDLTSSTLALEEDASADDAADDGGLPMIPKRRRNAGGHAAPSTPSLATDEDTAGRRRLWSISLSLSGRENNSECRCSCMCCLLRYYWAGIGDTFTSIPAKTRRNGGKKLKIRWSVRGRPNVKACYVFVCPAIRGM